MKKTLTLVLAVFLGVSMLFAMKPENPQGRLTTNKEQILVAGKNVIAPQALINQVMQGSLEQRKANHEESGIYPVKDYTVGDGMANRDCSAGDCWDLNHVGSDIQWYLGSGAADDTFAVAFEGAVPCIVQEVFMKWYDGGNVTAWGAMVSDAGVAATAGTGASVNFPDGLVFGRGDAPFSPIGQWMTNPTPNTIDGVVQDWSAQLDIGGTFQVGDENDLSDTPPFVIIFVKGAAEPHPLATTTYPGNSGMSYDWFAGPWTADGSWGAGHLWGNYQSAASLAGDVIDVAMLVRVTYPWGAPIAATVEQLCNTFATDDVRTVKVSLFDDDNEEIGVGIGGADVVNFFYAVDDGDATMLTLADATALDVGADGNGVYGFDVAYSAGAGSTVWYWLEMVDNMGLESETAPLGFSIFAPTYPDADLLIIADSDHTYYLGQYEQVLDDLNYVYEYWNVADNSGIHSSVINYGWENIIVYGWGNGTLPIIAGEVDPGYGTFLDNGGDLLLADQDWFYGHNLDSHPVDLTFGPGDPAFDWFGIGGGSNDPDDDGNSANGGAGDEQITALIPGLSDMDLINYEYGTLNWTDFLVPDAATAIFEGAETQNVVGTAYETGDRGSKRANLSFTADAAVVITDMMIDDTVDPPDTTYTFGIHQSFVDYVSYFMNWFAVASPPQSVITSGPTGIVYVVEDQEVLAEINDVNGDAFVADLCWSVNGGDVGCTEMSAVDRALYSGFIPAADPGAFVEYWVTATDVDGTAVSGAQSFTFASEVLFVLNNEMDPTDYPGWYYFYEAYALGTLYYMPNFWSGPVTEEIVSYYDIIFEITTTSDYPYYAALDDHYAIIQAWLTEGGKSYFLGGDETFGIVEGSWANMTYDAGTFFNDLGIAGSLNDINMEDPSPLSAVEGDLISGAMYDLAMANGATIMYDPDYEIGFANWLDGVVPTADATPFLFYGEDAVGIYKAWDNGSKTVFCGFDPLSINSDPYIWFGAKTEGPTIQSLLWFFQQCSYAPGNVNGDPLDAIDILDIVMLVGGILGTTVLDECQAMAADANNDSSIDILDVVLIVSWILGNRSDTATEATLIQTETGVSLEADGYVGGIQIEISHAADFDLVMGNAFVSDYVTNGTTTTMILVAPEGELFTATGSFQIEDVIAATTEGYIEVGFNTPVEFSLSAAYPNPFNPTTTLNLNLPTDGNTVVKVYNVVGQVIETLIDGNMTAGYHSITWNAANVPSGMYMIRAEAGSDVTTQKVMLLK